MNRGEALVPVGLIDSAGWLLAARRSFRAGGLRLIADEFPGSAGDDPIDVRERLQTSRRRPQA